MSATALPLPKVEHCMALVPFGPGMCDIHSIQPEQGIVTHLTIDDILQVTLLVMEFSSIFLAGGKDGTGVALF